MLGFGKGLRVLTTREIEEALSQGLQESRRDEEVWIISPYNTIDKLGTIRRAITEACKRGARVKYVVRDEPAQVDGARLALEEAIERGLELFALERLHAKLYWFDGQFAIVTSANMVDTSFDKSTELGLLVPPSGLFDELRKWINEHVIPDGRRVRGGTRVASPTPERLPAPGKEIAPKGTQNDGFCLRCGKGIPLNRKSPYCLDDYKSWVKFRNAEFPEKYCHACGGKFETTMDRPVCRGCFKKLAS
ncbi:MAG: phospholipase D family protein [bacterium]|nr:phospholipase D family protein [bacterium]